MKPKSGKKAEKSAKKRKIEAKNATQRKKLKDLSAEEFFSHGLDSDMSSDEHGDEIFAEDQETTSGKDKEDLDVKNFNHKSALQRLEEKDPEFFKFLQENDQDLLEFDESDDDDDDDDKVDKDKENDDDGSGDDDESSEVPTNKADKGKTAKGKADEQNEDDDSEDNEEDAAGSEFFRDGKTVDLRTLAKLKKSLEKNSLFSLRKLMRIFHDAVAEASDIEEKSSKEKLRYKVENSNVFNNLVQICLKSVSNVLQHHLAIGEKSKKSKKVRLPSESKQWSKVKVTVKNYLMDLLQLLRQISEPSMVSVVLRHIQDLVLYYACFIKITKMLIKRLVRMWSSAEEHVRVMSFLGIRKVAIAVPQLYEFIVKTLYVGFVKHAKFMNIKTKPLIAFMQNSLVEVFSMDHAMTYQFGFIYIRQMAIHLRNAMTTKKKDAYQTVYNWQYINCIQLWSRILGELHSETLAPLVYPMVQVTLGVIRLIPTARYYPLRFHCLRSLNALAKATNTYIPVASYLIEILESPEFNKKTKPSTAKAPDLSCALKLPKTVLHTKAFQDIIMENLTDLLLEHFVNHSTSIAFPELIFPICLRMKRFMKKTEVPKFSKQVKQMVDKLQEAGHELSRKRSTVNFSPKDVEEVKNWEIAYGQQKNSLQKFYETWMNMKAVAAANRQEEEIEDYEDETSEDEDEPKKKKRKNDDDNTGKSRKKPEDKSKNESKGKSKKTEKKFEDFEDIVNNENGMEDIVEDFVLSSDDDE